MEQDVRMRFNQTRNQGGSRKIDDLGFRRCLHIGSRSDAFNLFIANENSPAVMNLRRFAVENLARFEQINSGCFLWCLSSVLSKKLRSQQADDDETERTHTPPWHSQACASSFRDVERKLFISVRWTMASIMPCCSRNSAR